MSILSSVGGRSSCGCGSCWGRGRGSNSCWGNRSLFLSSIFGFFVGFVSIVNVIVSFVGVVDGDFDGDFMVIDVFVVYFSNGFLL